MTDGICIVIEVDAGTTITYASEQAINLPEKWMSVLSSNLMGVVFGHIQRPQFMH